MPSRNIYRGLYDVSKALRENIHDRKYVESVEVLSRMPPGIPSVDELFEIEHHKEVYKMGDKMYKFAFKYYGSTSYWWVIAWYNNKPTDAHFKIGDFVYVPKDLDLAIQLANKEER